MTFSGQFCVGVDEGSKFVFGDSFADHYFAFSVLPTIIFFSALMSLFYHYGVMQFVVGIFAKLMQRTLGTSGAESLAAAANVFVGQTEAPLAIRPYVASMTISELNAVMVGGFATIAGGVLAAFVGMGINAGHLLSASIISAPAALLIAKVMQPEVDTPKTMGSVKVTYESKAANAMDAFASGAADGLKLALNVGAMLLAFVALLAVANLVVNTCGTFIERTWGDTIRNATGIQFAFAEWSLVYLFGYVGAPFAWLMGISTEECRIAGEILSKKMFVNEFVAYQDLSVSIKKSVAAEALPHWVGPWLGNQSMALAPMYDAQVATLWRDATQPDVSELSERTIIILTYALCGFANFSSIGIQLGGIGGIAPERRGDLARLGIRAMLGGTLAAFMTAAIAGILL